MPDFSRLLLSRHRTTLRSWLAEDQHILLRLEFPRSGGSGLWFLVTTIDGLVECLANRPEREIEAILLKNGLPLRGIASEQLLRKAEKAVEKEDCSWQFLDPLTIAPSEAEFLALGEGSLEIKETVPMLRGKAVAFGLDVMSDDAVYPEWAVGRDDVLYLGAYSFYSHSYIEAAQEASSRCDTSGRRDVPQYSIKTDHPWLKLIPSNDVALVYDWISQNGSVFVGIGPGFGCLQQEEFYGVTSVHRLAELLGNCKSSFTATILPENPFLKLDAENVEIVRQAEAATDLISRYVVASRDTGSGLWRVVRYFPLESMLDSAWQEECDKELFVCRDDIGFVRRDLIPSRISEPVLLAWRFFASDIAEFRSVSEHGRAI